MAINSGQQPVSHDTIRALLDRSESLPAAYERQILEELRQFKEHVDARIDTLEAEYQEEYHFYGYLTLTYVII